MAPALTTTTVEEGRAGAILLNVGWLRVARFDVCL